MAITDQRLLSILRPYDNGRTAPEVVELLVDEGEDLKFLGGIPKQLSKMFDNGLIIALTTERNTSRVYVHPDYFNNYKVTELLKKPKKINPWRHCAELYRQWRDTGDEKYLKMADKLYEELT